MIYLFLQKYTGKATHPHQEKEQLSVSKFENSIAVLLFADMSPEKDQEHFCYGMTEQIISNLYNLSQLKVIPISSVMIYKNTNKSLLEIGKELNVAHVLESSIRKSGDRIRVTAQLIKTEDGFHIWSQDFDRDLSDIFDIQESVSKKIIEAIKGRLSSKDRKIIVGSVDVAIAIFIIITGFIVIIFSVEWNDCLVHCFLMLHNQFGSIKQLGFFSLLVLQQ